MHIFGVYLPPYKEKPIHQYINRLNFMILRVLKLDP